MSNLGTIVLSRPDADRFIKALTHPRPVNERLARALEMHRKVVNPKKAEEP